MFSGIQEILVLLAIVLGLFFIPRMMKDKKQTQKIVPQKVEISGRMRLALVLTVLWPVTTALYLQPWQNDLRLFLIWGTGPVIFGWCIKWVFTGFKKTGKYPGKYH